MPDFLTPLSTLFRRLFANQSSTLQPDAPLDEAAWLASWPRHDLPAAALSFACPPYMVLKDTSERSLSFHGAGLFGALLVVMMLDPAEQADWHDPDTATRKLMEFVDDDKERNYQFLESGKIDAPTGGTWLAGSYGADENSLALGFVHGLVPTAPSSLLILYMDMGILDARPEGLATITAVARSIGPLSQTG